MTSDDEKSKQPEEPLRQSSAPARKTNDLEAELERYPPETIEALAKMLEQVGSDPAIIKRSTATTTKLSYYKGDLFPPEILGD